MSAEKPRYVPSDVMRNHSWWPQSGMKLLMEIHGFVPESAVQSYLRIADGAGGSARMKAWFIAAKWDIRRWAEENGVEL